MRLRFRIFTKRVDHKGEIILDCCPGQRRHCELHESIILRRRHQGPE